MLIGGGFRAEDVGSLRSLAEALGRIGESGSLPNLLAPHAVKKGKSRANQKRIFRGLMLSGLRPCSLMYLDPPSNLTPIYHK